jgi:hypothetical protein
MMSAIAAPTAAEQMMSAIVEPPIRFAIQVLPKLPSS